MSKPRTIAQYKAALEESESERMDLARECSKLARENIKLMRSSVELVRISAVSEGQVMAYKDVIEIITGNKRK